MILGTVIDELERRDLSTALVTLCIGAGMGTATIIERVNVPRSTSPRRRCGQRVFIPRRGAPSRRTGETALGDVAGLTQFGVNLTRLKPGAASSLRHWHEAEDELIYVLEGK
jgi:hypothetical protein